MRLIMATTTVLHNKTERLKFPIIFARIEMIRKTKNKRIRISTIPILFLFKSLATISCDLIILRRIHAAKNAFKNKTNLEKNISAGKNTSS